MKFSRVASHGLDGETLRVVIVDTEGERVVDARKAYALALARRGATIEGARRLAHATFRDMTEAVGLGNLMLDAAEVAMTAADDASSPLGEVDFRAAITPPVLRDSLTFNGHIKSFFGNVLKKTPAREVYERPGYFKGSTGTILGTNQTVPYPSITEKLDYELEIGYVIGKSGRSIEPENAFDHLFGITIFNDWSLRDVQVLESPIGMGAQHSKDFAYGIGPWIVTMDEIQSIIGLRGQVRVNGEVRSDTRVEDFIWTPQETIAYASQLDFLQSGDLIGSGTMALGSGVEISQFLNPGDVLELELEKVGVLRSPVSREKESPTWWPSPQPFPFEEEK
jgi:2-keto-4-pentenoate hydratase/2-oxohepta-3-ene-1,7-dioic acid hydratase in catechol pathway